MAIVLIDKIKPKNDAFEFMVEAENVSVEDTAGYFTEDDLESVLAELGAGGGGGGVTFSGYPDKSVVITYSGAGAYDENFFYDRDLDQLVVGHTEQDLSVTPQIIAIDPEGWGAVDIIGFNGGSAYLGTYTARGTYDSRSNTLDNDLMGRWVAGGWNDNENQVPDPPEGAWEAYSASIEMRAVGDHASGQHGSKIDFIVTPSGTGWYDTPTLSLEANQSTFTGTVTINDGGLIINEGGGDYDTRIESDGDPYHHFLDASEDQTIFGGSAYARSARTDPTVVINAYRDGVSQALVLKNLLSPGEAWKGVGLSFYANNNAGTPEEIEYGEIRVVPSVVTDGNESSYMYFYTYDDGSKAEMLTLGNNHVTVNPQGYSDDHFRVRGDTIDYLLYANVSSNSIGFGTSTPSYFGHWYNTNDFSVMLETTKTNGYVQHYYKNDAQGYTTGINASDQWFLYRVQSPDSGYVCYSHASSRDFYFLGGVDVYQHMAIGSEASIHDDRILNIYQNHPETDGSWGMGIYSYMYQAGGTNSAGNIFGVYGKAGAWASSGSYTVHSLIGTAGQAACSTSYSATNGMSLKAMSPSGTLTNAYGLYVEDVTAGSSSNYAIKTNDGAVDFGDDTTINDLLFQKIYDGTIAYGGSTDILDPTGYSYASGLLLAVSTGSRIVTALASFVIFRHNSTGYAKVDNLSNWGEKGWGAVPMGENIYFTVSNNASTSVKIIANNYLDYACNVKVYLIGLNIYNIGP
jgi:hypothetical protein